MADSQAMIKVLSYREGHSTAAVTQCCTAPLPVLAKPRFPQGRGLFATFAGKVPSIPTIWGHRQGGAEPCGLSKKQARASDQRGRRRRNRVRNGGALRHRFVRTCA